MKNFFKDRHWSTKFQCLQCLIFWKIAILSRKSPFGTEGTEIHWPVPFQNFWSTSANFQCQHWDLGALNFSAQGTEALIQLVHFQLWFWVTLWRLRIYGKMQIRNITLGSQQTDFVESHYPTGLDRFFLGTAQNQTSRQTSSQ